MQLTATTDGEGMVTTLNGEESSRLDQLSCDYSDDERNAIYAASGAVPSNCLKASGTAPSEL